MLRSLAAVAARKRKAVAVSERARVVHEAGLCISP